MFFATVTTLPELERVKLAEGSCVTRSAATRVLSPLAVALLRKGVLFRDTVQASPATESLSRVSCWVQPTFACPLRLSAARVGAAWMPSVAVKLF